MYVDPRGPRFGAAITTVVLAAVLMTSSGWLLAAQAVVFGIGAFAGMRYAPYGVVFRLLVRPRLAPPAAPEARGPPRLAPPAELEAQAPPRFAQGVGFAFAVVGAIGYLGGLTALGVVATAFALT